MPPRRAPHVVVVGGGAAGLAAAARLSGRGVAVTLLEARGRLGGRVDTRADPALGLALERGAEFVHGRPGSTLALARRARAGVREVPDHHLLHGRGRLADATAAFAEAQELLALGDPARRGDAADDVPFAALLRRERGPRGGEAAALALEFVRGFYLADPGAASSRALAEMTRAMEELGGDVTSRVEGGYARILSPLARALDAAGASVRLGAAATRIRWRPGQVTVEARGLAGSRLSPVVASRAIVTVPLPMLQDGSLAFSPPLAEKRRAAKALSMGPVVKVLLRFRRPPRPASGRRPLVFLHVPRAPVPVFWTLAPLDAPVIVGWAGGPHGARLAGRRADEVLRAALGSLGRGLGRAAVELEELLDAADVVDWTRDPLARGGYAVFPPGSCGASEALAGSVAETLFFAGEATAGAHAGTVEGALRSGERAAGEVLASLGER